MTRSLALIGDRASAAAGYNRPPSSPLAIMGTVDYVLAGEDGIVKQRGRTRNLITQVGDQWYADRAARILKAGVTITAISNATSAVVTTSGAHGLGVGDIATIAGVTPSGYNGSWIVTAVGSSTTFTIYVGTALGAGSVFGTVVGLTLPSVSGMRLGTGSTAPAKTGGGAAIGTYVTGSHQALDGGYPTSGLNGSSRRITYQAAWAAGIATATGIQEVALTFEQPLTDAAGTAANTIARALLSPTVNKGASDTLTVTWTHDLLGA